MTYGSPLSLRPTSMSCQPSWAPMPVPNALEMASFAANRAARNGPGRFVRQAIADLVRVQNAVQESLAELLVRSLECAPPR
jgi:hypothetical protein